MMRTPIVTIGQPADLTPHLIEPGDQVAFCAHVDLEAEGSGPCWVNTFPKPREMLVGQPPVVGFCLCNGCFERARASAEAGGGSARGVGLSQVAVTAKAVARLNTVFIEGSA